VKIQATNIGEKRSLNWKGKMITTGIFKFPVGHPIFLDNEVVKGDVICDRKHHGGIDQAVYAYSEKHYPYFKNLHPDLDWNFGMFGDIFKVGETILEVTKPRQPCKTLGVRFDTMKIVKQFWNSTMSGVYFKVLQTGFVKVGDEFEQLKSYLENPTIAEVYGEKRIEKKGG